MINNSKKFFVFFSLITLFHSNSVHAERLTRWCAKQEFKLEREISHLIQRQSRDYSRIIAVLDVLLAPLTSD